jgi:hypothetical protein
LQKRKDYLRWITASRGDSLNLITVDEICHFRADHRYTLVVTPRFGVADTTVAEGARRGRRSAIVSVTTY